MTEKEANELILQFKESQKQYQENKCTKTLLELRSKENECVAAFKHIITSRASRYKKFHNYDDLIQDGLIALFMAIKTYNPEKNVRVEWWINRYVKTKIQRSANNSCTIKFPMSFVKNNKAPHKELVIPDMSDGTTPYDNLQTKEYEDLIDVGLSALDPTAKEIVNLSFGMGKNPECSINKICKTKEGMTRKIVINSLSESLNLMKNKIEDSFDL